MTTAHRPTFDPARGKEAQRGPAYHQRLLPAHTQLKIRQPGQGGAADSVKRDLRAELLQAEAVHFSKSLRHESGSNATGTADKRRINVTSDGDGNQPKTLQEAEEEEDDLVAKRRRVLEETKDIDADSDGDEEDEDTSEDDSDDEDPTVELMRELEKIKRERASQKERAEQEKAVHEQEEREKDIAMGNPLLNPNPDFNVRRRWDDDVVFKNQARGTEDKRKKEFVNDLLRSDFHKRFMSKYIR